MQTIEIRGRDVPLNDKGFLTSFTDWDESVARALAEQDGLELTDCHWIVLRFLRNFYENYEVNPTEGRLIKEIGQQLTPFKCTRRTLTEMFPLGGCKHACRLAGLPDYFCYGC